MKRVVAIPSRSILLLIGGQAHQTVQYTEKDKGMKDKSKRRRAPVNCNTCDERVHEAKGDRIGNEKERKGRVQRVLELESCTFDRHLCL